MFFREKDLYLNAIESGLNTLKNKLDKLDVDTLKPVYVDLKILSDVVHKKVIEKDLYDEFLKKVNAIDTSGLTKKNRL